MFINVVWIYYGFIEKKENINKYLARNISRCLYLAIIALVLAGTIIDAIGGVAVRPTGVGVRLDGVGKIYR